MEGGSALLVCKIDTIDLIYIRATKLSEAKHSRGSVGKKSPHISFIYGNARWQRNLWNRIRSTAVAQDFPLTTYIFFQTVCSKEQ